MTVDIRFSDGPIVIPAVSLPSREIGSQLEFSGIVREMEDDRALEALYYEAYESMARRLLEQHFADIARSHPVDEVLFIHRLGKVPVGEASLFMRVLSRRRAEGIAFLAEAVIRLKRDVPIWKLTRPAADGEFPHNP